MSPRLWESFPRRIFWIGEGSSHRDSYFTPNILQRRAAHHTRKELGREGRFTSARRRLHLDASLCSAESCPKLDCSKSEGASIACVPSSRRPQDTCSLARAITASDMKLSETCLDPTIQIIGVLGDFDPQQNGERAAGNISPPCITFRGPRLGTGTVYGW